MHSTVLQRQHPLAFALKASVFVIVFGLFVQRPQTVDANFEKTSSIQLRNQSTDSSKTEKPTPQKTENQNAEQPAKTLSLPGRALMTFRSMVGQILWVAVPIAAFALVFHFLETFVLQRLVERFGWNAALWTGWIGTPIHESSHALLCVVFQHKIEKMALFQPDLEERRLGFVRHTYTKGKIWQEVGNFFIGLAPLAGGTIALLLFSWMLYPQLVEPFFTLGSSDTKVVEKRSDLESNGSIFRTGSDQEKTKSSSAAPKDSKTDEDPWSGFADLSVALAESFGTLFSVSNLLSWRFWLFLYLVMCVSVHMAPSASDYNGAKQGGLILLGFWLAAHLIHGLLGLSMESWGWFLWPYWLSTIGMLILATGLGALVIAAVFLLTEAWDLVVRRNH